MIWSILVSIIFFAGVALFIARLVNETGISLPDNRVLSFITADKTPNPLGEKTTSGECVRIFLFALAFRIFIFLLSWIACGIFSNGENIGFIELCSKWNLWDAPHYIEIAQNGYSQHVENGQHLFLVFFPLYPMLIRVMAAIVRNYIVAGILVSTLCYCGGCVLMYKLVTIDYSKSIARTSVVLLSVSPFSFYFGGIMTESTFFLVTIATFLAIRQHKWFVAGILGILASLTRSVGVFMVVPAAIEWVTSERPLLLIKEKGWKCLIRRFIKLLPIALTPIGTLIYLYINYRVEGDPFVFMKYQSEHWSVNLQFFGKTLRMLFSRAFNPTDNWALQSSIFIPGLLSATIAAIAILLSARRMRSMYISFMIVYFMFNAAHSWPISMPRYMLCIFPAFWLTASLTNKHKQIELLIAVAGAVCLGIYLTGYITVHQIM